MTNTAMKLIILSLCLSMAFAVPTPQKDNQSWKPAGPKDLSKYKLKTPSRSFAEKTEKSTQERTPLEFKKGSKSFEDICGLENPGMDRIVGGHEAAENEWPWQVALFIDDAWFCGGSIISDEYIMTAAHCADGASYFNILAGAHDVRASSEPHRVEITSYEGFTHPAWDPNTLENDIALVRLPEKIEFNDYIRPACLPPAEDESNGYVGELTTPVGWGKNADSAGGITPKLQMVEDLPVIDNPTCDQTYGIIYDGIMCIDSSNGKGVCNGDSGGSLNMRQEAENKWTQVGVASFVSSNGCESGDPHGFTRVAYFGQWIESETGLKMTGN
eukprot:TRINITY_DN884_c0_g1_i6.p1 TRINITY_DN884_c0_g1~~TRINITY_DN884_c0_g1_i6.p1  ORF type:complete len:329 (+),score=120.54 TRINITY_DN884_c0_g1_i6:156-1142(+)